MKRLYKNNTKNPLALCFISEWFENCCLVASNKRVARKNSDNNNINMSSFENYYEN